MTDFRSLLKELADDLSLWVECETPPILLPNEQASTLRLLCRAYKYLSETKPSIIDATPTSDNL